jgi:hypothetical protein
MDGISVLHLRATPTGACIERWAVTFHCGLWERDEYSTWVVLGPCSARVACNGRPFLLTMKFACNVHCEICCFVLLGR